MKLPRPVDSPMAIEHADGEGEAVFVCEHASWRLPDRLGTLGLAEPVCRSHIAWDIGALELARSLAAAFDGTLCYQRFSRLAYDCNRPPASESAIPARSEIYAIPGNCNLDDAERAMRVAEIYLPFRDGLAAVLDDRATRHQRTVLVTVHTFTPIYFGRRRVVDIGILHDRDSRLADAMLAAAAGIGSRFLVRRNEPYGPADGVTHTLIEHGIARGIPNVMIEVRNDLVGEKTRGDITSFLISILGRALGDLDVGTASGKQLTVGAGADW